jgi:hypothetical protein
MPSQYEVLSNWPFIPWLLRKVSSAWWFTFLSRRRNTSWCEIMHLPILGHLPIIGDFPLHVDSIKSTVYSQVPQLVQKHGQVSWMLLLHLADCFCLGELGQPVVCSTSLYHHLCSEELHPECWKRFFSSQ